MLGQQHFIDVCNAIHDMILVAERDTLRIVYANQTTQRITGYSLSELCELTLLDLHPAHQHPHILGFLAQLPLGDTAHCEEAVLARDGTLVAVETWTSLHQINGTACLTCLSRGIQEWRAVERQLARVDDIEDISGDQRAVQRLRESEETARALLNATNDMALLIDTHFTILAINEVAARRAGKPVDELIGKFLLDITPPQVYQKQVEVADEVIRSGQPQHFEDERDGLYFSYAVYPLFDAQGEVTRLAIHTWDTTAHRQAIDALHKSKEHYRGMVESQIDLIVRLDLSGCFTFVNDAYCQKMGKRSEELIGSSFTSLVHPEDLPRALEELQTFATQPRRITLEQRNATATGWRWIAWEGSPIRDETGQVIEVQGVGRDITKRKQAEEALRQTESLLRGVAQATNRLLEPGDFTTAIHDALAIVGEASEADRVYIFEGHTDPVTGEPVISQRFEWARPTVSAEIGNPLLQNLPWRSSGLTDWHNTLTAGQIVSGPVSSFPEGIQKILAAQNILSLLNVPIFINQVFWGFVGFDDCHSEREWSGDQLSVLRTVAASISAALQRQRVENTLRREREIAETLREIGTILSSTLDLNEVLVKLLEQVKRVVPYDTANVRLIENESARIVHSVGYDRFGLSIEAVNRLTFEIDQAPIIREIIQTGLPYVCVDVSAEPKWVTVPGTEWIGSWMGAPIVVQGAVVGFFSLDAATKRFYKLEDAELIAPFAQQAATAYENALLYQKVEEQARELATRYDQLDALHAAGQALVSSGRLDELLMSFARQITTLTHATSAIICDYEPGSQSGMARAVYTHPDALPGELLFVQGERVSLKRAILQQSVTAGKSILLWAADLPRIFPEKPTNRLSSMMIVPMVNKGIMTGFVLIGDSRPDYTHSLSEMRMGEALANQAAIALEQARLFADIQELEQIKSDAIRMASHDLRGPLNRLQGYVNKLEDLLSTLLYPDYREYFVVVQQATREMSQIITELLTLERIEARFRDTEQVNWYKIVDQAVESVKIELQDKQHTLAVECPSDLPPLRGDAIQLRQAMVNLLGNAIKYTPPCGNIVLRLFRRDYGGKLTVAVEVEDNGIGIPPERQAHLFQPFYRAQQEGTENIPGAGVGLSVVRTAVEYHRGKVYFDSEPGTGSLFGFWVPV